MSVVSITKKATTNERVTPELALIDLLDQIRSGYKVTRLLVITQTDLDDDGFDMGWFSSSGMKSSDQLALVEMHKANILRDMGL